MSYALLVLPTETTQMTPAVVRKIKHLVSDGAPGLGPRPSSSPSLAELPRWDEEVTRLASEVWGDCDGSRVTEHRFGKGRVVWGQPLSRTLGKLQAPADFKSTLKLNWIHRQADGAEIYFVANDRGVPVEANCSFRVKGMRPEVWNPETGETAPVGLYEEMPTGVVVPLYLQASGSVFVVFRSPTKAFDPVVKFTRDGQPVLTQSKPPVIEIQKATYGGPGDAGRLRYVREKLQGWVDAGDLDFQVAKLAEGDDPAFGVVKTLTLEYTADGRAFRASGRDTDKIQLDSDLVFTTGTDGVQGLRGEYFTNTGLTEPPIVVRTDAAVEFSWNSGSPVAGIPANNWSARWSGLLTALKSGEYTFSIHADDGCRLLIGDRKVIEHWELDGGHEAHTGKINLMAGRQYPFRVEYFHANGNDGIQLAWQMPADRRPAEIQITKSGRLELLASKPGEYEMTRASGRKQRVEIKSVPAPLEIAGPWNVQFPTNWGAPNHITLDHLISLSDSDDPGVRFFSGTATYTRRFVWTPEGRKGNLAVET